MPVSSSASPDGSALTIAIKGRFDFSAHRDFRGSYEHLTKRPATICVDLRETTYLDSSALGMLLLLRDFAGGDESAITITNCNPDVRKILSISNFDQLFTIQE
ncbi:STAS domain-containing protein [Gilvimarinus sp. F26214L]|uniref:STAS domain-containing protein n=1 Tax=Gilvimarinus sp. DZF01 TaxID=3461371 RepID=UPI0040461F45